MVFKCKDGGEECTSVLTCRHTSGWQQGMHANELGGFQINRWGGSRVSPSCI